MKKSVLIIPIKSYSERVPRKNFTLIKGYPLYTIFPITCQKTGLFDDIFIDTDSDEIRWWAKANNFSVLHRVPRLTSNSANGNDLLRFHRDMLPGYDYYWQGFITTPFVSQKTITSMHTILTERWAGCDSVMTCKSLKGFFWTHDGKPLTHRPDVMPRSQDLTPIYQERHGLFGVTVEAFDITRTRAGLRPAPYVLPDEEDVDIDYPSDLQQAQGRPVGIDENGRVIWSTELVERKPVEERVPNASDEPAKLDDSPTLPNALGCI